MIRYHPEIEDVIRPVGVNPLDLPTDDQITHAVADIVLAVNDEHYTVLYLGTGTCAHLCVKKAIVVVMIAFFILVSGFWKEVFVIIFFFLLFLLASLSLIKTVTDLNFTKDIQLLQFIYPTFKQRW